MNIEAARIATRVASFTLCTLAIGINTSGAVGVVGTDGVFSPAVGVVGTDGCRAPQLVLSVLI